MNILLSGVWRKLIIFGFALFLFVFNFYGFALAEQTEPRSDKNITHWSLPSPEPNSLTGALIYDYPISIPPGRNNLQPDLKLQYNNQNVSQDSIFGAGWADNIPYIQRINKEGSDNLYSKDYFYSSFSGELVATSSHWRAKVDNGDFLSYATSSDTWVIKDKQGSTYIFGNATSTRQDDPSDSSKIFKWFLAETKDANNNSITYEYYKDVGQIYPSAIKYTHSATSTDGIFEIDFLRESRSDIATSSTAAFTTVTNYRINEIDVKINGNLTRKYAISYAAGDNGQRSLINTITETGYDESGTPTSLPATDFDFQSTTNSWTQDSNWSIPSSAVFTGPDGDDYGIRIVDVNGDGLADLVRAAYGENATYINNGTGWSTSASSTWAVPDGLDFVDSTYLDRGVRLSDINGDGLVDMVKGITTCCGDPIQDVYLNNGAGWTESSTWSFPANLFFVHYYGGEDEGLRLFDINGDGLADFVYAVTTYGGGGTQKVYINNGVNGWLYDSSWSIPSGLYFANYSYGNDQGVRMEDVNGDGLLDFVKAMSGSTRYTYLNTGTGWVSDPTWVVPVDFVDNTPFDRGVRFGDVNGDGLVDIVRMICCTVGDPAVQEVYINDGSGWTYESSWTLPSVVFTEHYDGTDEGTRLADINGDGLADLTHSYGSCCGVIQSIYLNNHKTSDAVTRVTYPQGGKKEIEYKASPQYTDGSGNLLNDDLPLVLQTAATTTESDGLGLSATKTHTYAKGKFYFNTFLDRKYSGFGQVTEIDDVGTKVITSYHGGTQNESNKGQYQDHISKAGKAYRVEKRDANNNLYSLEINKWDRADLGNDSSFIKLAQSVNFSYDGDTSHKEKAESATYNDTTGNITQRVQWGEVTGSDDGSFTDTGSDKFTSALSYATNASSTICKLSQEITTDQSANKVRESRYYYDGLSLGSLTDGNLTKEEKWKTGSSYIDTEKSYNDYGLVTQEKDPRNKATDYTYDSYNLYVATSTDPVGNVTAYLYDYSLGKPKQTTDANSRVFQTVFDGLDRVKEEKQPDATTPSTLVTKTTYAYTNETVGLKTQRTDYLNAATTTDTYIYTDGLNRIIQTRKEAENANTYAVTDVVYNNRAQVEKQSLPYFSTGTTKTSPTATSTLYTLFAYDPLLRVTSIANAVGTTTTAFADWKTTVTDQNGKQKNLYKDAYDNLWKVEELNATSTYTTLYEYDGNKNLTKITDALNNIRNFTYDGLGRRLTAQDLHASGDGTYGTWTYTYDDSGNPTTTVDPKSQTINHTFDDINRVLTEDYTGQSGTEFTYSYDTCTNGKTRLCSVVSATATTTLAYSPLGKTTQETKTIDGTSYQTDYEYDRQGNLTLITNPNNSQVKYDYNTAGQLESIAHKEAGGGGFVAVVVDFNYGPDGKITYQEDGNGVATNNTYDADALYRLTHKETTYGGVGGDPLSQLEGFNAAAFDFSGYLAANTANNSGIINSPQTPANPPAKAASLVKRGWNYISTPTAFNGTKPSEYQTEFHIKWINYKTPTGWKEINTDFMETPDGFAMTDAPFEVVAPLSSTGVAVMHNNNRWNVFADKEIPEAPLDLSIHAQDVNDVPGRIVRGDLMTPTGLQSNVSYVLYEGAYPEGDLIYYVDFGRAPRLEKLIRFNTEPTAKSYSFDISYSDKVAFQQETKNGKAPWNEAASLKSLNGEKLHVTKNGSNVRGIGFKQFQIWDSDLSYLTGTSTRNILPIEVDIEPKGNNGYVLTKILPDAFFTPSTVYPVYTDTTSTFYPDPNTETTSVDGYITNNPGTTNWPSVISASAGTSVNDSSTAFTAGSRTVQYGNRVVYRGFTLFDTSSLADSDIITSTTYSLYALGKYDGDNDGNDYVSVITTTPASNTALVTGDLDQVSSTEQHSSGERKDITSISTGGYLNWTLNTTGMGNVSLTSITKFGIREGHDLSGDQPESGGSYVDFSSADTTGTSQDPKLTVVTSSAATAPTNLETEDQTNPIGVADSTPEFSAIYNDPDSGDSATYYRIQVATSTDFSTTVWDSNKTILGTPINEGSRSEQISYAGGTMASSSDYYWRIKFWDVAGGEGVWSTETASFTLNTAPSEPTSLLTEGSENPTNVIDPTPEFSAIFNDSDSGEITTHFRIQVATSSSYWGAPDWDSQKTALSATSTEGVRIADISYSGTPLGVGSTYYWRIKLWDDVDAEGAWSTSIASFTMSSSIGSGFQNLAYFYDASGNITKIVDASATNAAKTTEYTYDDLSRLITASTTNAVAGSNYSYTYTYDAIGNISSSTESGAYTYAGTNYANPHAATTIGSTTYAYDNNGNLVSRDAWSYVWDYANRMTSAGNGTATSTYAYDHTGQRIQKASGGITTVYPTKYYNTTTATSTEHIFTPSGELIATFIGTGTATTTQYIHTDHLGGTGVVTDTNGDQIELTDYYPYGAQRINEGSFTEQRKYTGHEYDTDTDLTYANARYYDQGIGRFNAQDPAFLAVGDNAKLKNITQLEQERYLENPQHLNSYSYTINNPLKHVDEKGEFYNIFIGGAAGAVWGGAGQLANDTIRNINGEQHGFSPLSEYGASILRGGVTGAAFGSGIGAGIIITGAYSSAESLVDKGHVDYKGAAIDMAISGVTAGLLKQTPQVRGALPNFGTQAFFTGKHTQRALLENSADMLMNFSANNLFSSYNVSSDIKTIIDSSGSKILNTNTIKKDGK